jgi:colanic acid biosynthesis glycosyl transferase WcaI
MGLSQGLENLLQAAQSLVHDENIAFILVGEGANKPALEAEAKERGLSNVKFFSFLPREEVPMIYALADICLVSLKRDIVVESVPSKTYTILASGRPIVATVDPNTETGRLIDQAQCGLCVEPENPEALTEAILQLYRDTALCREMGKRGRDFAVANFSRLVAANQYYQLIARYTNHKRP